MLDNTQQTVYSVFEKQSRQYSSKVAIEHGEQVTTYEDLASRVDHLSSCMDIKTGEIVATWIDPSTDLVSAALSIFKKGAIYMPLDISAGKNRIADAFELTECRKIVTSKRRLSECVKYLKKLRIPIDCIYIIKEHQYLAKCSLLDEIVDLKPRQSDNVAIDYKDKSYIFHTSGTTGKAKSILGSHKSLLHFINWEVDTFDIQSDCRVSFLSNVTFDASLRDIFVPLCKGGTVCIPAKNIKSNLSELVQWIDEKELTLLHCVPSILRLIIKELEDEENANIGFEHLRNILMAGEVLYSKDITRWRQRMGTNVELVNLYGTSETTLAKTYHRIDEVPEIGSQTIHVGQPISDTFVAIINSNNKLCKIGEIGEVYIKTAVPTYGYYKQPDLTQSVFVQNPLVETKDIVHRTGDLGRYLSGRDIEILGRTDSQVKVNGIRVELEEIENAILSVENVEMTTVIPFTSKDDQVLLAAYFTGDLDEERVKDKLHEMLSDSFIPAVIKRMDEFPLTMNGKIDKKILPNPSQLIEEAGEDYEAPITEVEQKLEPIWKEVLGLKQVSRSSSFFDLGGTSLRCLQAISKIFKTFQVLVKVSDFFSKPTIEALAKHIEEAQMSAYNNIPKASVKEYYDLSAAQKRIWVLDELMDEARAYNVTNVYSIKGELEIDAFKKSVEGLIERHEALRTNFKLIDGQPRQIITDFDKVNFDVLEIDLTKDENKEEMLRQHLKEEAEISFDLSQDFLIKASLIKMDSEEYVFTFTLHHIITDGWSIEVLTNDLFKLYNHFTVYTPKPKALSVQYKDYVEWSNKSISAESLEKQKNYWVETLKDASGEVTFKPDHSRPDVMTVEGKTHTFVVDPETRKKLEDFCTQYNVSPFMFFYAIWLITVYKNTGKTDVLIGSPVANREHPDLENMAGLFMNMIVLRAAYDSTDQFVNMLQKIKQVVSNGLDNGSYPFDNLLYDLDVVTEKNRNPLFDIGYTFINELDISHQRSESEFSNLDVSYLGDEFEFIKADLWLKILDLSGDLMVDLSYNINLFKDITIKKIMEDMSFILNNVLENAENTVDDLCANAEKHAENTGNKNKRALKEKNISLLREMSV